VGGIEGCERDEGWREAAGAGAEAGQGAVLGSRRAGGCGVGASSRAAAGGRMASARVLGPRMLAGSAHCFLLPHLLEHADESCAGTE
jgi:hypothetical protein